MSYRFERALTRLPGPGFAAGITRSGLGPPDLGLALEQHAAYCEALRRCGLEVKTLPPDPEHPDSTFVEDTMVLSATATICARPGAPSRRTEVRSVLAGLEGRDQTLHRISAPGTLDAGDVCQAEDHFFVGLSARTNEMGALQLRKILHLHGYSSSLVDIRGSATLLHLKSGLAYLGDRRLAIADGVPVADQTSSYELLHVGRAETYAANCVRINDHVLVARGYPRFESALRGAGLETIALDMSEFRKMDGGLSCLSLRY